MFEEDNKVTSFVSSLRSFLLLPFLCTFLCIFSLRNEYSSVGFFLHLEDDSNEGFLSNE